MSTRFPRDRFDDVDAADPDAFATVSLDGVAVAVSDPFGTRVRWFRAPNL